MAKNHIYLPPDSVNKLHMIQTDASNILMGGLSQSKDFAWIILISVKLLTCTGVNLF